MRKGYDFEDVLIIPKASTIKSRHDVNTTTQLGPYKFKVPIIAANMDRICESKMAIAMDKIGGLGVIHRFNSISEQYEEAKKIKQYRSEAPVAVALGLHDLEERAKTLSEVADIFVVDIAHGHNLYAINGLEHLSTLYPDKYLIGGNVATKSGADDLYDAGAHCIKIGIGPGKVCKTRTTTGCGIPQLTAIQDVTATKFNRPIPYTTIADGGIKNSGDIVKALAAGATMVMLGYLLAGTEETPGRTFTREDGSKFKFYRGMSSYEANNRTDVASEGRSIEVPHKGSVETVIYDLVMGLKSGMSYVGAYNLEELVKYANFMET